METITSYTHQDTSFLKNKAEAARNLNLDPEEANETNGEIKYAESNLNVRIPSIPNDIRSLSLSHKYEPNGTCPPEVKNPLQNSEVTGFDLSPLSGLTSKLLQRPPMDIKFSNLTFCVRSGKKKSFKTILNGASGKFLSGQLSAIMGPSGAGKSTLMNILAGYRTSRVSGEILVNGKERNLKTFGTKSCYIMQDDHLLPFLTIQETMDGAATLKLGEKVPQRERNSVVSDILNALSLNESRSTRVSNLSGGEKKRLSIALELINNPPVMFLDEPTSGLDSRNSYYCISLLKRLANEGRTIICTIHQPSARIFEMFDHLYALSEGQCIYRGTVPGLIPFLSSFSLECPSYHNPADFLIEVASGEFGSFIPQLSEAVHQNLCNKSSVTAKATQGALQRDLVSVPEKRYSHANDNPEDEIRNICGDCVYSPPPGTVVEIPSCGNDLLPFIEERSSIYPASFCTQFSVLFKRTFLSIVRDTMLTKLRFAAHIVVGIFIGVLYYNVGNEASEVQSNVGCHFFSILFLLFTAMMPTILTFPLEMNVFIREHLNHWYSLKAYYFAKTMADVPFQFLFPILYVVIVYFLTDQPYDIERFFLYTLLCILTSLVAQSIGLAIGAAMDIQQAVFFGPASAIPALLFSGFFVTFSTIPIYLRWLTYLSYVRYGYEGAILTIFGMNRSTLDCSQAFCMLKYPKKILEQINIGESNLWFDFLMLIIYFIVMRGLGYFILRWKLRKER